MLLNSGLPIASHMLRPYSGRFMATNNDQQNSIESEYYHLSGIDPVKNQKQNLTKKKIPWKIIIFLAALGLILIWFWWNVILIKASSK